MDLPSRIISVILEYVSKHDSPFRVELTYHVNNPVKIRYLLPGAVEYDVVDVLPTLIGFTSCRHDDTVILAFKTWVECFTTVQVGLDTWLLGYFGE